MGNEQILVLKGLWLSSIIYLQLLLLQRKETHQKKRKEKKKKNQTKPKKSNCQNPKV